LYFLNRYSKNTQNIKFRENLSVGDELFHANERTNERA
jgi:hypothetical protein